VPDYQRRNLPQTFLPLSVPVLHILLALSDHERHGYALIQAIRESTGGEVDLTASTLYAAVKRLLDDHLVEELRERPQAGDDQRRRYYRITPLGRDVVRLEAARLERTVRIARQKRLLPRQA
jgi:DNA-binding PadR family transcriptional regulator